MIFLYFFLAIVLIIGLYFVVELSVKYCENRKLSKIKKRAEEQTQLEEFSMQQIKEKPATIPLVNEESTIIAPQKLIEQIQQKLGNFAPGEEGEQPTSEGLLPSKATLSMNYVRGVDKKQVPIGIVKITPHGVSGVCLRHVRRVNCVNSKLKVGTKSSKKRVAQSRNKSLATVGVKSKAKTVIPDEN